MVSGGTGEGAPDALSGEPGVSGGLVGRDLQVGHLVDVIRSGVRVVNVCGPAGVGKSALVAAAVSAVAAGFDEVRFVDVDGAGTTEDWPAMLERSLGLPARGRGGSAALRVVLGGRTLLVLDHAEAVVSLPQLEVLVAGCPRLQVVVITVARLGPDHLVVGPLKRADAERLFVARAAQAVLGFVLDEDTRPYVDQICEAIEGLPLALELAAARLPTLSLPLLARELTERRALSVLSGPANARVGGVGVRECLEGSCAHLSAAGARLFAVSGIFEDSFSLEALIEVAGGAGTGEVFDELARLVDLRLLEQVPDDDDGVRYRLPGLVRELARHRLEAAGWFEQTGERHARFFASVARRAAEDVTDALDEQGLAVLRLESAQLWAALDWLHLRRPVEALRLAADLTYLADRVGEQERCRAVVDGLLRECTARADDAVDSWADAGVEPAVRRDALLSAGTLALRSRSTVADTELARERLSEGTVLARRLGEPLPLLWALSQVTLAFPATGELEPAQLAVKEGIELARAIGHARWRGRFETWLGMLYHASGETVEAARWGQLGLRRALRAGDPRGVIAAGLLLHPLPPESGVDRAGLPSLVEMAAMAERLGDVTIRTHLYAQLAAAALACGDLPGSARWVLARLELVVRSAAWHGPGYVLMQAAMIACLRGDDEVAARLHGPVSPMLDVLHGGLPPPYAARYRACIAAARDRVGAEVFEALVADASPQPWDEALTLAKPYLLSVADPKAPTSAPIRPDPTRGLTPREQLVLANLVAGRRNKEIAALLGITPKTVMHHSVAIYRKLGVRGRAEAAVLALREGLIPAD